MSETTTTFDPSIGVFVKALPLSATMAIGTTTFAQLRQVTVDPRDLQANAKRRDDDLEEQAELHEDVQRALAGNKKTNVPKYADYIAKVVEGGAGVLPPIHLWTRAPLDPATSNGQHFLVVPSGEYVLPIDGETQLTGHYFLAKSGATDEVKQAHKKFPLAIVVHHGVPTWMARQYFHDLNVLAVRPNTSVGLSMDSSDPLMQLVMRLIEEIPVLKGRVDRTARQLPKSSPKVATLQAVRQAVVNVAKGIAGIQYGARPVPVDDVDLDVVHDVALKWLGRYFDTFAAEIVQRESQLAGSGTVLAAVGAMGNRIVQAEPGERPGLTEKLLDSLRSVDWTKDDHWTGIAGAPTPKGMFSVKGTKETAYAVYNALNDASSSGYARIRHLDPSPWTPSAHEGQAVPQPA